MAEEEKADANGLVDASATGRPHAAQQGLTAPRPLRRV
jgi:hypothetical protein